MPKLRWIAGLALVGGIIATAFACGSFPEPDEIRLFNPATGANPGMDGLLFDTRSAGFGITYGYSGHFREQNVLDWSGWLAADTVANREWEDLLYRSTLPNLDSLVAHLKGKGLPPSRTAALRARVPKERLLAALEVLRYTYRMEPQLTSGASEESWESNPATELPPDDSLFHAGLARAQKEKDPFLRQRWFFLLEKFLFHTDNDSALKFLDRHEAELKGPSPSLWWRSRMDRAGLLRKHDVVAANLECARVAAHFPPLAEMAANDFIGLDDSLWDSSLSQASPPDRAALLFLAGLRTFDPAFLEAILRTDSSSTFVSLLAARHIGRWEIVNPEGFEPVEAPDSTIRPLAELALLLSRSRKTASPAFWNLLAGHFDAIHGKRSRAEALLDSAGRLPGCDSAIRNQIRISRAIARLRVAKTPDPDLEAFLVQEIPRIDSSRHLSFGFEEFFRRETARIWERDTARGFLLSHRSSAASQVLGSLVRYWEKANSPFDRFVKARSGTSDSALRTLWGMSLLYDNQYSQGLAQLERTRTTELLGTDPFNAEITDDHDRDHARFQNAPDTRLSQARELVALQAQLLKGGPDGAKAALRLGIGLYNRTYFGNSRILMDGLYSSDAHDPRWTDLEPARKAFAQAARDLPTAEGRAWATWLLAKCERDRDQEGRPPVLTYASLRKDYAKTPFWRNALKECGWLRDWHAKHP